MFVSRAIQRMECELRELMFVMEVQYQLTQGPTSSDPTYPSGTPHVSASSEYENLWREDALVRLNRLIDEFEELYRLVEAQQVMDSAAQEFASRPRAPSPPRTTRPVTSRRIWTESENDSFGRMMREGASMDTIAQTLDMM